MEWEFLFKEQEQKNKRILEVYFSPSTDFWDMIWKNNFNGHNSNSTGSNSKKWQTRSQEIKKLLYNKRN